MNILDVITRFYGKLHNYKGVPYWVLTPIRRLTRHMANYVLPRYLTKPQIVQQMPGVDIIVSFTSFPGRIKEVWKVVECLKRQSVRPEKIILWLSRNQFLSRDSIPQSLKEREDSVFEIRMVDGDIRSHKKYYYAMQEYPEKIIVTCDDDVYYHSNTLNLLVETSKKYPGCIIANVTSQMTYNEKEELLPYLKWNDEFKPLSSLNNVQIGIGGVLYPPYSLNPMVFRQDLFLNLAPMADDLWLSLMARLNKTPVVQTEQNMLYLEVKNDGESLSSVNNGTENMNDVQIKKMREWLISEGLENVYSPHYNIKSLN